jgi:hypothetical protein
VKIFKMLDGKQQKRLQLFCSAKNEGNLEDAREQARQSATPGAQSHEATSQSGSGHGTVRRAKV